MNPLCRNIIIIGLVTFQHDATLLLAQSGRVTLVAASLAAADERALEADDIDEGDATANYTAAYLSYSLRTSPIKISLAQISVERGSSEEIRSIARQMISDEAVLNKKLKTIGEKHRIFAPIKMDDAFLDDRKQMRTLSPSEIDRQFVDRTIVILEEDIAMLRRASECEDRWVRMIASEELPRVEGQWAALKAIRDKSGQER